MPRKKKAPVEEPVKGKNGKAPDLEVQEVALPAKKNGRAKSKKDVDFAEFSTEGDLVDIWERRVLNPGQKPATPIRLVTPGMHLRWINLTNTGRYQRARYEEGWVPVHRDELKDEKEIYGATFTVEGWVCRGEKQSEMLMKIPEAVWRKIRKAKIDAVHKSNKRIRENMQSAGAKHFADKYNANRGDEVAGELDNFKGNIRFGNEQVSPDEDDMAAVAAGFGE